MSNFVNMSVLKVLVIFLCLSVTVRSLSLESNKSIENNRQNKYRLPDDTVPVHYNIKLNPHIVEDNFTFNGDITVDFKVRRLTSDVVLNAKNLTIYGSATTLKTPAGVILKPNKYDYNAETEMLHIHFEDFLEPGIYTLNMKFKGMLSYDLHGIFNGLYWDNRQNMVSLIATHFQPMSARRGFPCWDEPALKATFNMSIKHWKNYTALSNMPAYAQELDDSDGKMWTHFETTPIMSTNILAFVITDYVNVSNPDGTIRLWTRKDAIADASYFLEIAEQANAELSRYLNSSVRVPKMDHITVPQYSARATENWGLIVYLDHALLYNNETDKTATKVLNILTATHELAHQWFGNLVSPAWWKYYWLSEGMATYLKSYIADKMFKDWRLNDMMAVNDLQSSSFGADDRSTVTHMNRDFSSSRDMRNRNPTIIYKKSSAVLRMLSHIVTEDVFRAGLIKYVDQHEYRSVTSDDLWKAMQDALNESDVPHDNFLLKDVMDTWVEQTGYPLVTVTRNYTTGETTVRQEPSPTNKDRRRKEWWIPINYVTKSNPDFSKTIPTHWLRPGVDNVTIEGVDVDDWIIVNVQQTGYYRVNYDPLNWRRIAKYLNSDNYTNIHVINRGQIIDDAYNLMMSQSVSPVIFVELTNYLSREVDYIPWLSVLNMLPDVNPYLRIREGAEILKPHILSLMNNIIETFGFEEHLDDNDFIKLIRPEILTWACKLGHPECKPKAAALLLWHLENPGENKILPNLKEWAYCNGLMKANQSVWNKLLYSEDTELSYSLLQYLTCSEDPSIIENYLNMALTKGTPISNLLYTAEGAFMNLNSDIPIVADAELNFIIKNWDKISSSNNTKVVDTIIDDVITRMNTQDQFDKLKDFCQANGINADSKLHYRETAVGKIRRKIGKIRSWLKSENDEPDTEEVTVNSID